MNAPYIAKQLSRRRFLQSAGVTLALPLLECMTPVFGRASQTKAPRRLLIISNNLGFLPKPFCAAPRRRPCLAGRSAANDA